MTTQAQKAWFAKRTEAMRTLKMSPCVDCGQSFDPCAMDFDHKDPRTKVQRVSRLVCSWGRLIEEVQKCELVCACCHRLRTAKGDFSQHTRRYKHHRAVVDELKESLPCVDCGRKLRAAQMDLDHQHRKIASVGHLLERSTEVLMEEIQKCHLVCANCHRVRSRIRKRPDISEAYANLLRNTFLRISSSRKYPADLRLTRAWHQLVGTMPDVEVAKIGGVSRSAVSTHRRKARVPAFRTKCRRA
jgi:hypothetical protein